MDQPVNEEPLLAENEYASASRKTKVNIVLLVIYFIFRIPVIFVNNTNPTRMHWHDVTLFLAFYLIIAALIWNNRRDLHSYRIDRTFLWLFILFGSFLRKRMVGDFITLFLELFIFFFIVVFAIALIRGKYLRKSIPVINKWNGIAILSGFVFVILIIALDPTMAFNRTPGSSFFFLASVLTQNLLFQMGSAAIIEEPIFRGFLWGTLEKRGWSQNKIFLFQALLFWISHISLIGSPFSFWVIAPAMSLLLGYLALKSKSLLPPVITHIIFNAFVSTFAMRS